MSVAKVLDKCDINTLEDILDHRCGEPFNNYYSLDTGCWCSFNSTYVVVEHRLQCNSTSMLQKYATALTVIKGCLDKVPSNKMLLTKYAAGEDNLYDVDLGSWCAVNPAKHQDASHNIQSASVVLLRLVKARISRMQADTITDKPQVQAIPLVSEPVPSSVTESPAYAVLGDRITPAGEADWMPTTPPAIAKPIAVPSAPVRVLPPNRRIQRLEPRVLFPATDSNSQLSTSDRLITQIKQHLLIAPAYRRMYRSKDVLCQELYNDIANTIQQQLEANTLEQNIALCLELKGQRNPVNTKPTA